LISPRGGARLKNINLIFLDNFMRDNVNHDQLALHTLRYFEAKSGNGDISFWLQQVKKDLDFPAPLAEEEFNVPGNPAGSAMVGIWNKAVTEKFPIAWLEELAKAAKTHSDEEIKEVASSAMKYAIKLDVALQCSPGGYSIDAAVQRVQLGKKLGIIPEERSDYVELSAQEMRTEREQVYNATLKFLAESIMQNN
jgi:hypothetical protein